MPNRYGSVQCKVVSVRMFLVILLVLVLSPWIFEVKVEAQKLSEKNCKLSSFTMLFSINNLLFLHIACEMEGMINGSTLISRRSETCGVVKNITTIEECENGQWKEICDRNFTQEDAQVICRDLGLSAIRKLAHDLFRLDHALLRSTRLQSLLFNIHACTAGVTAGYLSQGAGASTASYYPECNGQESSISECHHVPLSECNSPKVYVTCFEDDPCSNVSAAEPTFASPATQLPTATSVASISTPHYNWHRLHRSRSHQQH